MLANRLSASGRCEASMAIEVMPASKMVGISTVAAGMSPGFLMP